MLDNATTRALDLRERLNGISIDVLARRTLKNNPSAYGLSEAALCDDAFMRDTKEREQALLTVVTQAYRNLWFAGQGGKIVRREISTAGGEGGHSVVASIRDLLIQDGKLVTPELAVTATAVTQAAKLFFNPNKNYQPLEELRSNFACRRNWPVLEDQSVFAALIRAGVRHGAWCLFRMRPADTAKPGEYHSRETGELPLQLNLNETGWHIVTAAGAKQRNWTPSGTPDPIQIRKWLQEALEETPYCSVAEATKAVIQKHGDVSPKDTGKAVDDLIKAGHVYVHAPSDDPARDLSLLRGAKDWVLETVSPDCWVVTKPEAATRGWITQKQETLAFSGEDARIRVLPLLKRLGQIYQTGGTSAIRYLEVSRLKLPAGGRVTLQLADLAPEDIRTLDELLDPAMALTSADAETEVQNS